jgi:hypothetical protein
VKSGCGLYLNLSTLLRDNSFSIESSVIEEYLQRAITLSREGMFSVREYIQILHLFSRSTNVLEADSVIHLSQFIGIIESKLRINNRLKNSMTVIDVAVGLNSVARIKKCPKTNPIGSVLGQLHDQLIGQVCVRMSMFEDHHLAQILHSIAILNRPSAVNVGKSIFRELCDNRDVSAFNLQALVMLASSISRIVSWPTINEDHHVVQNSQKIWQEIMRGVLKSNKEQFQPKWPDVFLTSFAFSRVRCPSLEEKFLIHLTESVKYQFDTGMIGAERIESARDILQNLHGAPSGLQNNVPGIKMEGKSCS